MRGHPMVGQLVRFLFAGGITTALYTAVYLPLATWVFARDQAVFAVPPAFLVAVTAGFWLHSRWSFRGHGERTGAGQQAKFVGVQASGLAMHAAITWVATDLLNQPPWVPLIPGVILVPIVTFFLNRQWVFR
ncbi:GtrA family protein [Sphingomonas sp. 37zxx]|uniref:GtrA family protein n=1 Tax=Sphingomonas sp. 37zxx TaxID=1550073 RepID=UPI001E2BF216|nr:GtrA family protein [Sphingomonas sp. 37zxx]